MYNSRAPRSSAAGEVCEHDTHLPQAGQAIIYFIIIILSGVRQSTWYCGHYGLLYQPQMIDDGACGAIGRIKIGRGNRSTRRKPVPVPLGPPQILHDLTRARTRTATVGSQRLTA
jgi:hypothetical protein